MRLNNLKNLEKLKKKNIGYVKLAKAIDELVHDLRNHSFKSHEELKKVRPDADRIHQDGFYFFNINVHRTMVMAELNDDKATFVWVGSHDDYENTFKNNRVTIEKWLKDRCFIN